MWLSCALEHGLRWGSTPLKEQQLSLLLLPEARPQAQGWAQAARSMDGRSRAQGVGSEMDGVGPQAQGVGSVQPQRWMGCPWAQGWAQEMDRVGPWAQG